MARRLLALLVLLWLAAPAATLGASEPTTVRVFQVRYRSVTEVAAAVQTLLTDEGSLTVHPRQSRITVQDRPEVVVRAAEMIARMDRSPDRFLIDVVLLQGGAEELPPAQRAPVDARLKRMFPPGKKRKRRKSKPMPPGRDTAWRSTPRPGPSPSGYSNPWKSNFSRTAGSSTG